MNFEVDGKKAFAYTAAHELDPAKPTVVFVHGAGLDHSLFGLQSRYFGYHGRNVLALDLPGHGRSGGPPLPTSREWRTGCCASARTLNIEKAALVGHSMGSLVALECAARAPERRAHRVDRHRLPDESVEAFLEAARRTMTRAFDMTPSGVTRRRCRSAATRTPACGCTAIRWRACERLAPGVLYADLKACNDYAAGSSAAKVKCPVLFILGRRDVMTPPRARQRCRRRFANAKTVGSRSRAIR